MKSRTSLKAGAWNNHNETLVRDPKSAGLKIKTRVLCGKKGVR